MKAWFQRFFSIPAAAPGAQLLQSDQPSAATPTELSAQTWQLRRPDVDAALLAWMPQGDPDPAESLGCVFTDVSGPVTELGHSIQMLGAASAAPH